MIRLKGVLKDAVTVEGIASSDAGAMVSGLSLLVHVVN